VTEQGLALYAIRSYYAYDNNNNDDDDDDDDDNNIGFTYTILYYNNDATVFVCSCNYLQKRILLCPAMHITIIHNTIIYYYYDAATRF